MPFLVLQARSDRLTRFLPLIPFTHRPVATTPSSTAHGKAASLSLLSTLEVHLNDRNYLVGIHMTLADIMVAMYVGRGLEWVLTGEWRDENKGIMRHFGMVAAWGPVRAVVPTFEMVDAEAGEMSRLM